MTTQYIVHIVNVGVYYGTRLECLRRAVVAKEYGYRSYLSRS